MFYRFSTFCVIMIVFTFLCMACLRFKDWLIRIVIVVNNYYVITVFCLCRNEIIPRLKEYNIFFEGRKALQLTSKEVWCVFFLIVPGASVADNKIITYRVVIITSNNHSYINFLNLFSLSVVSEVSFWMLQRLKKTVMFYRLAVEFFLRESLRFIGDLRHLSLLLVITWHTGEDVHRRSRMDWWEILQGRTRILL